MKKASIAIVAIAFICLSLQACADDEVTFEEPIIVEEEPEIQEPEVIEILDLSDAWNTILTSSTKSFIGGHPIDEGFLSFVTKQYGSDVIETIAGYANFDSADIWFQLTGKSIHVLWYEYGCVTGINSFENIYVIDSSNDDEVVLDFTGDFSLAENIGTTNYMHQQINGIFDCFSPELITEMHSADVLMINNEFAYTNRGEPLSGKTYTFRADPSLANNLHLLGVDVAGIANNHVYDYGEVGILDTFDTLEAANIPYVGAGRNLDEASKPIYLIVGGRKIAIVAATQIERSTNYTKAADETSAGVLKCLHPEIFCDVITDAKKKSDYVIAFVHWGTEGNSNYGTDQVRLARKFVEAGADAIIGGHTHCLQTVEYMDDVPIYFSLGNYYFDVSADLPAPYETGIAQLRIKKSGKIEAYFKPCYFDSGVTSLLNKKDDAYGDIINNLNDLSNFASIDENGLISKKINE